MEMPIKAHGYGRECPISAFVPSGPVINVSGWTCGWDFAHRRGIPRLFMSLLMASDSGETAGI